MMDLFGNYTVIEIVEPLESSSFREPQRGQSRYPSSIRVIPLANFRISEIILTSKSFCRFSSFAISNHELHYDIRARFSIIIE